MEKDGRLWEQTVLSYTTDLWLCQYVTLIKMYITNNAFHFYTTLYEGVFAAQYSHCVEHTTLTSDLFSSVHSSPSYNSKTFVFLKNFRY